jgi:hypothetical protein
MGHSKGRRQGPTASEAPAQRQDGAREIPEDSRQFCGEPTLRIAGIDDTPLPGRWSYPVGVGSGGPWRIPGALERHGDILPPGRRSSHQRVEFPIQRWEPVQSRGRQNAEERPRTGTWRIRGRRGGGATTNRPVGRQPIQRETTVATSPGRKSSSPWSLTRTSSPMEKSEKTKGTEKMEGAEETEESEDSYYIPDDYYSEESGYDSDMFKKCWELSLAVK